MLDRLKIMDERYEEINRLLLDTEVVSNIKLLTELSKEQRGLEKAVMLYREQIKLEEAIPDLKEMKNSSDAEMSEMASIELDQAIERIAQIEEEVKILLLPKDPNDEKMLLLKFVVQLVEMKQTSLQEIYSVCILSTQNLRVGKLKC